MNWVRLEQEIPSEDRVIDVSVDGHKLTLVKYLGKISVFQRKCPHAGGLLSGGWCERGQLICPIHRYSYDLETGRGAPGQGDYIKKYPIEQRPDGVYVGFSVPVWKRFFG